MVDRQTQWKQLEHLEISNETFTAGERIMGLGRWIRSPCRRRHDNGASPFSIEAVVISESD